MKNFYTPGLILMLLFTVNSTNAQVDVQDSTALVNLYNSTHGPGWKRNDNWLSTFAPLSTWYGVTVTNNRVTGLSLNSNLLEGILPPALGNLTALDTLSLSGNSLSGSISSASYGNLTNLEYFDLSSNLLNDTIPGSLSNLSGIKYLNLSNNKFTGSIPFSLGNITGLQFLNLSLNRFKGNIPSSFSDFAALKSLDLSYNSISGDIPPFLSNLLNLTDLNLAGNIFSGNIPASLGNLIALQNVDLSENLLTGNIPSEMGNLINLQRLLLNENELSGDIPASLNNLINLRSLNLFYNQLSGNIPSFGNLLNLDSLYLSTNQLTGSIPSSFDNLTNLQALDLSYNKLSGTVPSLENLSNLSYLELSGNQFTFSGIEDIAQTFSFATYAPQATIPLYKNVNTLSVSAGGNLSNETFYWYKNGILDTTIAGDSTYTINDVGEYNVNVTNSAATQLTLYSAALNVTILPVQLIGFTGSLINGNAVLNWKTTQERNSSHFNILRSEDGIHFSKIDEVKSAGTSNYATSYTYTDAFVIKMGVPKIYYRLQQVDNDGKMQLSNTVSLDLISSKIAVYPNPASNFVYLDLPQQLSQNAVVVVFNMNGKSVLQQNISNGYHTQINISGLAQGNYYLMVLQNDKVITKRSFIVAK
ncbi:MAG: leucine-rich repeat domain-containing protein [Parafilimonas sp.]|nr:leucine-rich repeat domain-containing protein [Parafilimonas sp.]